MKELFDLNEFYKKRAEEYENKRHVAIHKDFKTKRFQKLKFDLKEFLHGCENKEFYFTDEESVISAELNPAFKEYDLDDLISFSNIVFYIFNDEVKKETIDTFDYKSTVHYDGIELYVQTNVTFSECNYGFKLTNK